jgi:hypothetical protein
MATKVRQLSKNGRDVPGKEKAPTLTVKGPFPRSRLQMRFRGGGINRGQYREAAGLDKQLRGRPKGRPESSTLEHSGPQDLHRKDGNIIAGYGAFYGGKNATELGEYAVAGGAADPTAMLHDERIGDGSMSRECCQRAFLIEAHQRVIALDIGGKDCDELSLEWRGFHRATKSQVTGRMRYNRDSAAVTEPSEARASSGSIGGVWTSNETYCPPKNLELGTLLDAQKQGQ